MRKINATGLMRSIQGIKEVNRYIVRASFPVVIISDQLAKYVHINWLESYVLNYGISFGIRLYESNIIMLALLCIIFIIIFAFRKGFDVFVSLLLAGAISNLCDRLYYGAVIDYINFFGIFWINLADISISTAIIGIFITTWKKL